MLSLSSAIAKFDLQWGYKRSRASNASLVFATFKIGKLVSESTRAALTAIASELENLSSAMLVPRLMRVEIDSICGLEDAVRIFLGEGECT